MLNMYLIRHAESEMQLKPHLICGRSLLTPLTSKGRIQAKLLGKRLATLHIDELWASPAVRAYDTMDLARLEMSEYMDINVDDALLELHKGDWEDRVRAELFDALPDVSEQAKREGLDFSLPNGESPRQVTARMMEWAVERSWLSSRKTIATVSSGMAMNCLLNEILGLGEDIDLWPSIQNTSLTHVFCANGRWGYTLLNDCSHIGLFETHYLPAQS